MMMDHDNLRRESCSFLRLYAPAFSIDSGHPADDTGDADGWVHQVRSDRR
jgi:hypothetical protein